MRGKDAKKAASVGLGLGLGLSMLAPKVTSKFPIEGGRRTSQQVAAGAGGGGETKRWGGFKIALFLSIITVSTSSKRSYVRS